MPSQNHLVWLCDSVWQTSAEVQWHSVFHSASCVLRAGVATILAKDVIEPPKGFYSPYFIISKKGEELRPILALMGAEPGPSQASVQNDDPLSTSASVKSQVLPLVSTPTQHLHSLNQGTRVTIHSQDILQPSMQ